MESKELAFTCARLADNKKAENITLLDLRELSSIADYFVIVTGSNEPHLRAIVDEINEKLREQHSIRTEPTHPGSFIALGCSCRNGLFDTYAGSNC